MSRRAVWLAWSLCALCVALAAGSFVLALLNGRSPREILIDEGIVAVATLAVAFSVVGALIASHRPANPIGWIFCAAAVFQGVSICGYEYATYALLTRPGSLPLGAEAAWVAQWIWAPGLGLILVFLPLLFPDGRPPSRRWRPVVWLGVLSIGLNFVSAVVFLWPHRGPRWWDPKALRKKAPPTRCSWSSSSEPSRGCSWPGSAPWSPWSSASAGRGG